MKIAVTGARGFTGRAVIEELTRRGHEATGLARPDWDLCKENAWDAIPADCDVIIHTAAAFAGQTPSDALWRTNVTALMGLVRRCGNLSRLQRIILYSSGAVYAPQKEAIEPETKTSPQTDYGMSKLLAETMLQHGCRIPVTALRLFFPFGAGQQVPRLIPRLVSTIRQGADVKIRDTGGAPRLNPVPVHRVAAFTADLCESGGPAIFNLGGPIALTVKELAVKIGERMGCEPRFEIESGGGVHCLHCRPVEESGTVEEFEAALDAAVASCP